MSDLGLQFVDAPPVPDTFNVLAYGPPKSGKSTAAATAPSPILWVNAEGPNALDFARKTARHRGTHILEVRIERDSDPRQILRDVLTHLKTGQEPRPKTVVVDTLAKVRDALSRQIVNPGAKNSIQQWQEVARIMREFVQILRDAPVNVVLIAHQEVKDDADAGRVVQPLIGGVLTEEIPGEVDVIAYTHSFKDEQSGERRYVGQLVEAKGRIAGDRSGGLGSVRDLDLTAWLSDYRAALAPDTSDVPWNGVDVETPDDEQGERPMELTG